LNTISDYSTVTAQRVVGEATRPPREIEFSSKIAFYLWLAIQCCQSAEQPASDKGEFADQSPQRTSISIAAKFENFEQSDLGK